MDYFPRCQCGLFVSLPGRTIREVCQVGKFNDIVIFPGMPGWPLPGGARVGFLPGCQVDARLASVSQSWNVMGCRASCNEVRVCIVRMDCILSLNRKRLQS